MPFLSIDIYTAVYVQTLFSLGLILFYACHAAINESMKESSALTNTVAACTRQHALDLLLAIPEVQARDRFIDSLTGHKHGIAMIDYNEGKDTPLPYYEIHAGYSSEIRFENFYTFRVYKKDCKIEVDDPIDGLLPLAEWQKRRADELNRNTGCDSISMQQAMDSSYLAKQLPRLSDDCFSNFVGTVRKGIEKSNNVAYLQTWGYLLHIRGEEFLSDESLNMFVANTPVAVKGLLSADTVFRSYVLEGIGYNFLNAREYGVAYDAPPFKGKVLVQGITGKPEKYYLQLPGNKPRWFNIEAYLRDEMNNGRYSIAEQKALQRLVDDLAFARIN